GPIGCTVDFRCRLIHLKIILWNKPLEIGLCNKAFTNHFIIYFFQLNININSIILKIHLVLLLNQKYFKY
ncbi:hypothetical protein AB0S70_19710, partial [Acinetobacter baumannii]